MDQDFCNSGIACLRQDYVRALLAGSGRAADRVVEAALDLEVTPQRIYLDIFQQAAYEIGRLWQSNKVSVAQEHLATAIIERQMGELHPLFKSRRERRSTVVLGCVPDEWHRVGARMVADFFEADGWTVHYLGANVPVRELVGLARDVSADMVGLSAEMLFNLPRVGELVRALDTAGMGGIPVIAGGMPFIEQPGLSVALNLRGSAADAQTAVALANHIIGGSPAIRSAEALSSAAETLHNHRQLVVSEATARCLAAGDSDEPLISAGFTFTTRMLEAALAAGSPAPLEAQLSWANERQPHDGVSPEQLLSRLTHLGATLADLLPEPDGAMAVRYVDYLISRQRRLLGG